MHASSRLSPALRHARCPHRLLPPRGEPAKQPVADIDPVPSQAVPVHLRFGCGPLTTRTRRQLSPCWPRPQPEPSKAHQQTLDGHVFVAIHFVPEIGIRSCRDCAACRGAQGGDIAPSLVNKRGTAEPSMNADPEDPVPGDHYALPTLVAFVDLEQTHRGRPIPVGQRW